MYPRSVRPFPVDFGASRAPNTLEAWIGFQTAIGDKARIGVLEIMTTFAALGATGCLSGSNLNPGHASMKLDVEQLTNTSGYWLFQDVKIDPAGVCVLLNMIHWVHLEMVPVQHVCLRWPASGLPSDPLAIQFPALWPRLSFELEIGDLLDDIDLDINLQEPQKEEITSHIVKTMSMWLLATHRGAYADDSFDPSRSRVYLGPNVMNVGPRRIIWFIDTLRCNESALDGILNLLEWVGQKIARIQHVGLGP